MWTLLWAHLGTTRSLFRTQRELALENLALRQQVGVLIRIRGGRRPRLGVWDRAFWVILSQRWTRWKEALAIVEPTTVIRWHREGFKRFWRWKSRSRRLGRPRLDREVVSLIRKMSQANVTWSAPGIRNELRSLASRWPSPRSRSTGLSAARRPRPTWRAFLETHVKDLVAIDFFVLPTATFGVLFGLVVLAHHRRRVVHFNVTANPTAEWTARQVIQAFPEETAPRFLVRERDKIYGERFRRTVEVLGIEEVVTAARSPWQNPYAERLIGSLRRDCLDHVIVLDENHLRRILARYFEYYHRARCHLSLAGDAPEPRATHRPELGKVVELPEVGLASPSVRASSGLRTVLCPARWGSLGGRTEFSARTSLGSFSTSVSACKSGSGERAKGLPASLSTASATATAHALPSGGPQEAR